MASTSKQLLGKIDALGRERARSHEKLATMERQIPGLLRKWREGRGLGLREFARILDIDAGYLCDIELGRRPIPGKFLTLVQKAVLKLAH